MNSEATLLLVALGRTTLSLATIGLLTATVLRLLRSNWPTAHRVAWCLVLLVGWMVLRLPVNVPWYEAPQLETAVVAELPAVEPAPIVDELPLLTDLQPPAIDLAPAETAPLEAPPLELETFEPKNAAVVEPVPIRWADQWPLLLIVVWLLGMAGLLSAWLTGYARFVRALRWRESASGDRRDEWNALLGAAGVRRSIPLSVCRQFGPVLCRLPRGYELIVPESLWRELDAAQRQAILRHELAHYQRGDVWKALVVRLLALPHWFNPVAWLAVRRFEEASEWACDRAAAGESSATDYAKVLVRLGQQPSTFGYGSAARGRTLAARVRRILAGEPKEDSTMKKALVIATATVLVAASVVHVNLVAKTPTENEEKGAPTSSAGDEKSRTTDSKEPAPTNLQPPAPGLQPVDDLSNAPADVKRRLLEHARKAYEATQAAYDAQTAPLQSVFEWSLRWMQAAEAVATSDVERLAALRDHLKRMRQTQEKTDLLHKVGATGGRAVNLASANFYLADAERRVAEAEAAAAGGEVRTKAAPRSGEGQIDVLDLKIKIAELRGEQQEAVAEIGFAETALEKANKLFKIGANNVSRANVERARTTVTKWKSQLQTTSEKLELYQAMVKAIEAPATASAPGDGATAKLQALDLKIRIAELRGQQRTAAAELSAAEAFMQGADMAFKSNTITRDVLERARADVAKWKSQLAATAQQLKLYEEKMKLVESLSEVSSDREAIESPEDQAVATPRAVAGNAKAVTSNKPSAAERTLAQTQLIDLKIKIAELRGEREQTELLLRSATRTVSAMKEAFEKKAISLLDVERRQAEHDRLKSQLQTVTEQLKLCEEKLKLLESASTPADQAQVRSKPSVGPDESATTRSKPRLLYAGRDFETWADDLRNDLSPQTRTEAIKALAAFGAHGYGRQAAEAIMEAMKGYSVWMRDNSPIGQLKEAALGAFGYPSGYQGAKIAEGDALPVVLEALKSDRANQRLFGVAVLPHLLPQREKSVPYLTPMVADPSIEVRRYAANYLLGLAPETPGLVEIVGEALRSEKLSDMQWALSCFNDKTTASLAPLVPDLIRLFKNKDLRLEGMIGSPPTPARALIEIGPTAVPELEQALKSGDATIRQQAEAVLKQIREKKDADKAPASATKKEAAP